jgi:cell division protein FtsA
MTKGNFTCGIDVGTNFIKVVVIGFDGHKKEKTIIATGLAETNGMRLGYVSDVDAVALSIRKAVSSAEKTLGQRIKKAYVSIEGISLNSIVSSGSVIISKADKEITSLDVSNVLANSEENLDIPNRRVIHSFPLSYKLDGKEIYARPEGLRGIKLEVKSFFVTCLKQNIDDLATAFALAKINVEEIIASPLATSNVILNNKQKMAGCVLVDIGYDTISSIVYENNLPVSLQVFPLGGMYITKDIALGLKISLEEAESIKMGNVVGGNYSEKKVADIIEARLEDMFELIDGQLKKIKRNELLPAGIILTGGSSAISEIEEIARRQLKLPAKIGPSSPSVSDKYKVRDNSWYTALGLALTDSEDSFDSLSSLKSNQNIKEVKGFIKSILSQLLP